MCRCQILMDNPEVQVKRTLIFSPTLTLVLHGPYVLRQNQRASKNISLWDAFLTRSAAPLGCPGATAASQCQGAGHRTLKKQIHRFIMIHRSFILCILTIFQWFWMFWTFQLLFVMVIMTRVREREENNQIIKMSSGSRILREWGELGKGSPRPYQANERHFVESFGLMHDLTCIQSPLKNLSLAGVDLGSGRQQCRGVQKSGPCRPDFWFWCLGSASRAWNKLFLNFQKVLLYPAVWTSMRLIGRSPCVLVHQSLWLPWSWFFFFFLITFKFQVCSLNFFHQTTCTNSNLCLVWPFWRFWMIFPTIWGVEDGEDGAWNVQTSRGIALTLRDHRAVTAADVGPSHWVVSHHANGIASRSALWHCSWCFFFQALTTSSGQRTLEKIGLNVLPKEYKRWIRRLNAKWGHYETSLRVLSRKVQVSRLFSDVLQMAVLQLQDRLAPGPDR